MNAREEGGGPIEASVNMWALLADNDPGDSPESKIYVHPEVAAVSDGEVVAVPNGKKPQSRSGGDQKRKKKKRTKKQAKAPAESAAVANAGDQLKRNDKKTKANKAVANGAQRGGSSCVRALFAAAVTTALLAFSLHVSVAAAPAV